MYKETSISLTSKEWGLVIKLLEGSKEDKLLEKIKKKKRISKEKITRIELHKEEKIGESTVFDIVCFLSDNEKGYGFLQSNKSICEVLKDGFPDGAKICVFCRSETDSRLVIEGLKELVKELEKNYEEDNKAK